MLYNVLKVKIIEWGVRNSFNLVFFIYNVIWLFFKIFVNIYFIFYFIFGIKELLVYLYFIF